MGKLRHKEVMLFSQGQHTKKVAKPRFTPSGRIPRLICLSICVWTFKVKLEITPLLTLNFSREKRKNTFQLMRPK